MRSRKHPTPKPPGPHRPPLIAIIETSEEMGQLLAEFLPLEGLRVAVAPLRLAASGDTLLLLDWLAEQAPAVVVWDLRAADTRSWTAFERLRDALGKRLRFVLTTDDGDTFALVRRLPVPQVIVPKPYSLDHLLTVVRQALTDD